MDQGSLRELVEKFAARDRGAEGEDDRERNLAEDIAVDFSRPIVVSEPHYALPDPNRGRRGERPRTLPQPMEIEGSFYEWRKIMSDCSAACGKGKFP